jgi:hypothetical protein
MELFIILIIIGFFIASKIKKLNKNNLQNYNKSRNIYGNNIYDTRNFHKYKNNRIKQRSKIYDLAKDPILNTWIPERFNSK